MPTTLDFRGRCIYRIALQAEYLWNKYQVLIMDIDPRVDYELDNIKRRYSKCLDYLRAQGMGAVRINGVFRDLYL